MSSVLFVDDRGGSEGREAIERDLAAPLGRTGLPVEIVRLPFADLAFEGRGPGDEPVQIGIELKRIQDLTTSIRTGRLAGHQLPGLTGENAAFDLAWLVVEGQSRTDRTGRLQTYHGRRLGWQVVKGGMHTSELQKTLLTLELKGGLHVRHCNLRDDTVRFIADLYHWWTDKAFDAHTSHVAVHRPMHLQGISDFREVVARLPNVGLSTSLAVEEHFQSSLRRAVTASVAEWAAVATTDRNGHQRRLGTKAAERIVAFCRGEE